MKTEGPHSGAGHSRLRRLIYEEGKRLALRRRRTASATNLAVRVDLVVLEDSHLGLCRKSSMLATDRARYRERAYFCGRA
jgi:hypothetical protein